MSRTSLPILTPPVTSVHALDIRGSCLASGFSRYPRESIALANSIEATLAFSASRRVISNIVKKTAKPGGVVQRLNSH